MPFVEGMTEPYKTEPDPEAYRQVQRQRALERRVRKWKRRVATDKAWASEDSSIEAAKRLRNSKGMLAKAQGDLTDHIDKYDLKRLRYREQIVSAR